VVAIRTWWPAVDREIPWRLTRDPWAIHVSEVMSQQTQVDRVIPKWNAFMDSFPTVHDAAAADVGEIITLWEGLGYNRRAVFLHRCAVEVVERFDGRFPESLDALLTLPGVGPYTARAVLAFAFEHDVAVVDTNVGRVLARMSGSSLSTTDAQRLADGLVPDGAGWEWNQAILDFGARVCAKRAPKCDSCVVAASCRWRGEGADPAIGSANVPGSQSTFEGSDRQARGRLVSALRVRSLTLDEAHEIVSIEEIERRERIVESLLRDGLAVWVDGLLQLP